MIVGNKDQFAMEYVPHPLVGVSKPWGHFRMWVSGVPLGDFNDVANAGTVVIDLERSLNDAGKRRDASLFVAPKETAFEKVREALYGDPEWLSYSQIAELSEKYRSMDIDDLQGPTGKLFLFLISDEVRGDRLLWAPKEGGGISEAIIPAGIYESVAAKMLKHLQSEIREVAAQVNGAK